MDSRWKLEMFYLGCFVIVFLLIILPPLYLPAGTVVNIDGRVGSLDHPDLWGSLDPVSSTVYTLGDLTCHQMADRTFWINGSQLPVCGREFSLLFGAIIGMLPCIYLGSRLDVRPILTSTLSIMGLMVSPAEWFLASIMDADPGMSIVTVSGVVSGASFSLLLHCIMGWVFKRYGVARFCSGRDSDNISLLS